jgi:molecular chaperone GrpE
MSGKQDNGATPGEAAAADASEAVEGEAEEFPIEVDTSDVADDEAADEVAGSNGTGEIEVVAEAGEVDPIAELEARIEELEGEKKANYDRFLRATADLDNFRKRARRDAGEARIDARSRVLKEMLPVIDNLERALEHADSNTEEGGIKDGLSLVLRQFAQALERCEVTPLDAQGKPFDPNVHEAISQIETADEDPGCVAQVYQRGYMIGERLLRPSMVVVAKAPAEAVAAEAAPAEAVAEEPAEDSAVADEDTSGEEG